MAHIGVTAYWCSVHIGIGVHNVKNALHNYNHITRMTVAA